MWKELLSKHFLWRGQSDTDRHQRDFRKGKNKIIKHVRDKDLPGGLFHLRLKNLQGKGEYLTNKEKQLGAKWDWVPLDSLKSKDAPRYWSGSERQVHIQGFFWEKEFALKLLQHSNHFTVMAITLISLPSSLPGKPDKHTCNIQLIILLGLIPFAIPAPH